MDGRLVEIDAGAKSKYSSKGLKNSEVIKIRRGTILGIMGYNNSETDQYLQIFDSKTIPVDGVVPEMVIEITAKSNFSISFGENGYNFNEGISWSNSTDLDTKTIGSADVWLNAVYS